MKNFTRNSRRGSAIVLAVIFTMILGFLMGSYLDLARGEMHNSQRTYMSQATVAITEAIAENTIQMLLSGSTTGWSTADLTGNGEPDMAFRRLSNIGLGTISMGGKQYAWYGFGFYGEGFVLIDDIQGAPRMRIEGRLMDRSHNRYSMQIEMEIRRRSLFANGLTAKDTLTFKGGNVYVDSYDSSAGPYAKPGNYNDNGSVGTIAVVNDALSPGNGKIFGTLGSGGGKIDIGPNGQVWGWDTPAGVDVDPDRVSYDFFATFEDIKAPTLSSPFTSIKDSGGTDVFGTSTLGGGYLSGSGGPPPSAGPSGTTVTIGDPTGATVTYYQLKGLDMSGGDTLEIVGPVIFVMDGDIKMSGNAALDVKEPHGSLELYTSHNVSISGNGFLNESAKPADIQIYGTNSTPGGQTIVAAGNGALQATVYAPNANFELRGGGSSGKMMGAVVAHDIFMNGVTNFHYDESLADLFGPDASWRLSNWFEITRAVDRIDFDAIASGAIAFSKVEF